jgi:hypothetical protein
MNPSQALPSQTRPDRGYPAQMAGGPRRPAPYKRRWGAGGTDNEVDRAVHPTNTPNPSRSSGEAQPAAGLLTTVATSSPYSTVVPGLCRWRPEGRRDLVRAAACAASTPTVAMATMPPPAPMRGPTTHECVSRTPSLSLSCLDKIRLPRPNLCGSDREHNNGIRATNLLA